jgi:hypothetical protein
LGVVGNVGIGVALPSFKLQVNGSSTTPLNFLNNRNNTINILDEKNQEYGVGGGIIFSGKYTDAGITTELAGIRGVKLNNTSGNYSGQLEFYTRNNLDDDWTNDEKMIINNVGNIGIGTSSPNAKLDVRGSVIINEDSDDSDTRIESNGNANMIFVDAGLDRVGIGTASPSNTLDVNGTLSVTGAATLSSTLGVTSTATFSNQVNLGYSGSNLFTGSGIITDPGNLTGIKLYDGGLGNMTIFNKSTSSSFGSIIFSTGNLSGVPSERMRVTHEGNVNITNSLDVGGPITLTNTLATPSSLLGKNGSNVIGQVTTLTQTGLMKAGGVTQNTSSVGIITVPHGLSYTPSQVFVTVAQQSSYIAVCHAITSSDMSFTFYNSTTGIALNNVSVGFFWLAIK